MVSPATGLIDYTEAANKNPFKVNVVAYMEPGTFNSLSVESQNDDIEFWMWARDSCRETSLIVDELLNGGDEVKYWIKEKGTFTGFSPSVTAMSTDSEYGAEASKDYCGDIEYSVVDSKSDTVNPIAFVFGTESPEFSVYSDDVALAGLHNLRIKSNLKSPFTFVAAYSPLTVLA